MAVADELHVMFDCNCPALQPLIPPIELGNSATLCSLNLYHEVCHTPGSHASFRFVYVVLVSSRLTFVS